MRAESPPTNTHRTPLAHRPPARGMRQKRTMSIRLDRSPDPTLSISPVASQACGVGETGGSKNPWCCNILPVYGRRSGVEWWNGVERLQNQDVLKQFQPRVLNPRTWTRRLASAPWSRTHVQPIQELVRCFSTPLPPPPLPPPSPPLPFEIPKGWNRGRFRALCIRARRTATVEGIH